MMWSLNSDVQVCSFKYLRLSHVTSLSLRRRLSGSSWPTVTGKPERPAWVIIRVGYICTLRCNAAVPWGSRNCREPNISSTFYVTARLGNFRDVLASRQPGRVVAKDIEPDAAVVRLLEPSSYHLEPWYTQIHIWIHETYEFIYEKFIWIHSLYKFIYEFIYMD